MRLLRGTNLNGTVNRTHHLFRLYTSNYIRKSISRVNFNLLHVIDQLKMRYFHYEVVRLLVMPKMAEQAFSISMLPQARGGNGDTP